MYHLDWSVDFETIIGVIRGRDGGKESCVSGVSRRTGSGLHDEGAAGCMVANGAKGGGERGWKSTGLTGRVADGDAREAAGGGVIVQSLGGNREQQEGMGKSSQGAPRGVRR